MDDLTVEGLSSSYLPYVYLRFLRFLRSLINLSYNPSQILMITIVAICVASWGLVASLQSVAFSFTSLLVLRAALGIGEAAFVGVPFFMSFFYKRDELAFRTGLFISAAPLATSFASSLAWVITKVGSHIPIASWRLLFLLEGFPSIIVSVFVFLYIPDNPESAKYWTSRERKVAKLRLRKENDVAEKGTTKGLKWREIRDTLVDPKSYFAAVSLQWYSYKDTTYALLLGNVLLRQCSLLLPPGLPPHHHKRVSSAFLSCPPFPSPIHSQLTPLPPQNGLHPPSIPSPLRPTLPRRLLHHNPNRTPVRPPPHPLSLHNLPRSSCSRRLHDYGHRRRPTSKCSLEIHRSLPRSHGILLCCYDHYHLDDQQPGFGFEERNRGRNAQLYWTIGTIARSAFVSRC